MMRFFCQLFILLACLSPVLGFAQEHQDLNDIKQVVNDYVQMQIKTDQLGGRVEVKVGSLDPRLTLAQCNIPLRISMPSRQTNSYSQAAASVQCAGTKPWRIYVPVSVEIYKPVLVSAKPLTRGVMISEADFIIKEKNIIGLRQGYYEDPEQIVGKIVKRNLMVGAPFTHNALQAPIVIKRGEGVSIIAEKENMRVMMKGVALKEGGIGDPITVRNNKSKRLVEANVAGPGVVTVRLP